MMKSIISAAGLFAAAVSAYTPPNGNTPTYGALNTPSGDNPVITGQNIDIIWQPKQPSAGVTVSLVLCNGPSTNCVRQSSAIVEGVPASAGKYSWNVPCDLPLGTANTASGYGMLIIVDGTGEFQYSTQFSVLKGPSCGAVTTTSSGPSSSTTSASSSSRVSTSTSSLTSMTTSRPTSSPTSSVSYTDNYSSWLQWSGSVSSTSTLIRSTTAVPVTVTSATQAPATVTSAAATTTNAKPSTYTGAAAVPSAFVNVFAAVGAAGLAVLAL